MSANLHRRHLTVQQRSLLAAEVAKLRVGANQHREEEVGSPDPSIDEAARQMKVSPKSVKRAKKVLKDGAPELAIGRLPVAAIAISAA